MCVGDDEGGCGSEARRGHEGEGGFEGCEGVDGVERRAVWAAHEAEGDHTGSRAAALLATSKRGSAGPSADGAIGRAVVTGGGIRLRALTYDWRRTRRAFS